MQLKTKKVAITEAMKIIMDDRPPSILETHKGFFTEGPYPFGPPEHYGSVIIWPPVHVHPAAEIGEHVMIGRFTNICGAIKIGDHTRIQGFCFIPDSVQIGSYVFIGPGVTFCNVKRPRVRDNQMKIRDGLTIVQDDVNIGAGAIIGPGIVLSEGCTIGMGAVVTKNVPSGSTVIGCPARVMESDNAKITKG